ncbi:hypothetical protein, partial [Streptomyces lasiicapitis]|uniref:hypothetical protein n=1 Tax=Streptomyces lasiicapitis TaxID=1923961 RepID=UPI0036A698CC
SRRGLRSRSARPVHTSSRLARGIRLGGPPFTRTSATSGAPATGAATCATTSTSIRRRAPSARAVQETASSAASTNPGG